MRPPLPVAMLLVLFAATPAHAADPTWERSFAAGVGPAGADVCTTASQCASGTGADTAAGLQGPYDTAQDADGNVYVADYFHDRLVKFDASGNWLSTWGWDVDSTHPDTYAVCTVKANCRAGQRDPRGGALSGADGVAISPGGEVYVAEEGNDRISVFTRGGTFKRTWGEGVLTGAATPEVCDDAHAASCRHGTFSGKGGSFEFPRGMDFDQFGELFVTEVGVNRVQKFSASDNFLVAFGKNVDGAGGNRCTVASDCTAGDITGASGGALNAPEGLGVDPDGTVYVAEFGNHRISRFTRFGFFEYTWGKGVKGGSAPEVCGALETCQAGVAGSGPGEFDRPLGVEVDKAGNWYVPKGSSIESYEQNGAFRFSMGKDVSSSAPGAFGVCTVATFCRPGQIGHLGGDLDGARGLDIDDEGHLIAAETGNSRISKFAVEVGTRPDPEPPTDGGGEPPPLPPIGPGGPGAPGGGVLIVDTRILTGPTEVISGAPKFTFEATVPGATFQCWVDNAAPVPCTSPYTQYGIGAGTHTFYAKAAAGGRGDLTPASWPFTIGTTTKKGTCADIQINFAGTVSTCTPLSVPCPSGAECTVTGVAEELRDKDKELGTTLGVSGHIGSSPVNPGAFCQTHPEVQDPKYFKACPQSFSVTALGDGGKAVVNCNSGDFSGESSGRGADEDRVFTCTGELTTKPAAPLDVVGAGVRPGTVVPGPGKVTITGAAVGKKRVLAAAATRKKPKPPFKTLTVSVKQAGPVPLPFKLSAAAKKTLAKKRKLTLKLTVSFTPAGAKKAIVKKQKFTMTQPAKLKLPRGRRR